MSRSKKKNPVIGICRIRRETHKKFKKDMQKTTRVWLNSLGEDLPGDGSAYKKLMHSYQWRPDDGKQWWNNIKAYRK